MVDAIAHRGPDAEGLWLGDGVALGMRRLAVIDLETGEQPVWNQETNGRGDRMHVLWFRHGSVSALPHFAHRARAS